MTEDDFDPPEQPPRKPVGYRVKAELDATHRKLFKTRERAEQWLAEMEAKLKEANKLADGDIWTSIEIIYETRWDCPTARLAAA